MMSFRWFGGKELEWNGSRWELNIKIIKMARMAKSWNGVDIIYEWSKYDAKSIRFASYLRVKTGNNCTKIRYGRRV